MAGIFSGLRFREDPRLISFTGPACDLCDQMEPLLREALRAAIDKRRAVPKIALRKECHAVVVAGNKDFFNLYGNIYELINSSDAEGMKAYLAAIAALELAEGHAARQRVEGELHKIAEKLYNTESAGAEGMPPNPDADADADGAADA